MPNCFCYHAFDVNALDERTHVLYVNSEGLSDILRSALKLFGTVTVPKLSLDFLTKTKWLISDVGDPQELENFLELLKHRLMIDLSPVVDECYALGPYTLFSDGEPRNGKYGRLVNQAKYSGNPGASEEIGRELHNFVVQHPRLKYAHAIAAPPKLDRNQNNLPQNWARTLSNALGVPTLELRKTRSTDEQKNLPDGMDESDLVGRVANSMVVESNWDNADVLVVDDTLRSGGTLLEVARAIKSSGARRVYGLCAAKDAKGTKGGVVLEEDAWL